MGSIAACSVNLNSQIIVLKGEHNRKATFRNDACTSFTKVRIDGCVIKGDIKAVDWMLRKHEVGDLLVELKGGKTDDAVKQIHSTVIYLDGIGELSRHRAALVVSSKVPRVSGTSQALQVKLRKKHRCRIVFRTGEREYSFLELIGR